MTQLKNTNFNGPDRPNKKISASKIFNIKTDLEIDSFMEKDSYVPDIDNDYIFDKDTTLAVLAGFQFNRRVMIQGYHGTGKSTHIEQIAARIKLALFEGKLR